MADHATLDSGPLASGVMDDAVVLVVDDGEANVLLLQRLLTHAVGGRVVGINDHRQALEHYLVVQPDLILLDLHMPHLDGVEVVEALGRVIPPDSFTPILVLTADTTVDAKRRALTAGAKDFVTKPFEQSEMLLRVKNLLETRALHQTLQQHNAALELELRETAEREARIAEEQRHRVERVRQVLDSELIDMVFQPIVDLAGSRIVGAEALARFSSTPSRRPDEWFAEAASVGLGSELELLAVRAALARLDRLPPDAYLSVNVSPATALLPVLADILAGCADRIVLELTEHAAVDDYGALLEALDRLRSTGVRTAVDDAGSGFASLRHILRLAPDIIKLDIDLTRGIDSDPARRALAASLVVFADEIGAAITAEGIETVEELEALTRLGVRYGQGYFLARPAPLPLPTIV